MPRKVYVDVILKQDKDGNTVPLKIKWEDGRVYEVDRLLYKCKAASLKVGGCGMRYTVRIMGKETYLFEDDGRWFMEAKI
jgi:hypothetical protein